MVKMKRHPEYSRSQIVSSRIHSWSIILYLSKYIIILDEDDSNFEEEDKFAPSKTKQSLENPFPDSVESQSCEKDIVKSDDYHGFDDDFECEPLEIESVNQLDQKVLYADEERTKESINEIQEEHESSNFNDYNDFKIPTYILYQTQRFMMQLLKLLVF